MIIQAYYSRFITRYTHFLAVSGVQMIQFWSISRNPLGMRLLGKFSFSGLKGQVLEESLLGPSLSSSSYCECKCDVINSLCNMDSSHGEKTFTFANGRGKR